MLFAVEKGFYNLIDNMTSELFLKQVSEKYHYLPKDLPDLLIVAEQMQERILAEASFDVGESREPTEEGLCRGVVMTLGDGVDRMQDAYTEAGRLTESFMVEALGNEVLLRAYAVWNHWIEEKTDYHVAKYIFLGNNEAHPLEKLPQFLTEVSDVVTCNESYFMIPKKSVAFYALLTREDGVRCEGICQSCGRKDCQNRTKEERLLPYGYARIFGREFR